MDTYDVWLRLHLLSHRLIRPNSANMTGVFGLLTNVAWTSPARSRPRRSTRTGCAPPSAT